jgi:4-hydroxybenzoate polyprenyltransferase
MKFMKSGISLHDHSAKHDINAIDGTQATHATHDTNAKNATAVSPSTSVASAASATCATPAPPVTPLTGAFWNGYWLTLRPYLFFVSGAAGLIGLALAPGLGWGGMFAGFLAFFFAYGLGQALTDTFQIDTDSISSPYRPLTRGVISRAHVLTISLGGLAICSLVLALLNVYTLLPSALCVTGLITYTWFKRRWWGGPFWNAWIVALLPATGFLCGGARLQEIFGSGLLAAAMTSVFFSYAVFVLLGYFKDISADRATGYRTLPVVAGWHTSIQVSAFFAVASATAGITLLMLAGYPPGISYHLAGYWAGLLIWLFGIIQLARAHFMMAGLNSEDEAYRAILPAVRAFVLMHLGLAGVLLPPLLPAVIVIYGFFELALSVRPSEKQI